MAFSIRTFTITQAGMGQALQFQPALGSQELEDLVDAYVTGSASKQDKFSQITLDFFHNAQVDIYTGLLTRHYNVALSPNWTDLAFEQSPTVSQSSGSSPSFFTPSPASSMTFADSGYGSISMTPPSRALGAPNRVAKKPKKDTKKTAEVRLPGFSIMTKDGVDVTSSAGRGTKTKEQREHAHLMRIMKACDACKRKKIRCDPSHRRPQTDMSRSSTSTTSSSRANPSPPVPSLSRAATHTSAPELPPFGGSAIDDFVLFPEDSATSWNPADMSLGFDDNLDLGQFDFDIDIGLNDFPSMISTTNPFDIPPSQQLMTDFQLDRPIDHDSRVATGQYGLNEWASQGNATSQTRPYHSLSSQDSAQLDSSWYSGTQSAELPASHNIPDSQTTSSLTEAFLPGSLVAQSQIAQPSLLSLPSADWRNIGSSFAGGELSVSSSTNRTGHRNLLTVERAGDTATQELADHNASAHASESRTAVDSFDIQHSTGSSDSSLSDSWGEFPSPGADSSGSLEYWGLTTSNPTLALIAMVTSAAMLCQFLTISILWSGLNYLVATAIMCAPLFRKLTASSFGEFSNSSQGFLSNPFANSKDPSLLSLFNELTFDIQGVV